MMEIPSDGDRQLHCCVCLEETPGAFAELPCCGRGSASIRCCTDCLKRTVEIRRSCPACRMPLGWDAACRCAFVLTKAHVEPTPNPVLAWVGKTFFAVLWFLFKPLDHMFLQALEAAFSRGHV